MENLDQLDTSLLAYAHSRVWDMAVQRVTDAKAVMDDFYNRAVTPVSKAHAEGSASAQQVSLAEDASYVFVMVHHDAIKNMVLTKAPTLAALAFKVEIARDDCVFDGGYSQEALDAVLADIAGLAEKDSSAP